MAVESASSIAQLDSNWPLGIDEMLEGDDHIRLLKAVLKATFPGANGQGFAKPITISEDDLNGLVERVKSLEGKIDNRYPVGHIILSVKNGWNPNKSGYPGRWECINGDASLCLGNNTNGGGFTNASNSANIPVAYHSHGASTSVHIAGNGAHSHSTHVTVHDERGSGNWLASGGYPHVEHEFDLGTNTAGYHGHSATASTSISATGTRNPTINVRGNQYRVNVWKRVA